MNAMITAGKIDNKPRSTRLGFDMSPGIHAVFLIKLFSKTELLESVGA